MNLVDFGVFLATIPDGVRLLIIPVFAWVAWRDIKTRRVPNQVWTPLIIIGGALFLWEAVSVLGTNDWMFFAFPAAISLFVVLPAAFLLWLIGAFGGADAKAIMTLSIVFPTYPGYYVGSTVYPLIESNVGSFAFAILSNAVVLAVVIPLGLALTNLFNGERSKVMGLGLKRATNEVHTLPGRLLETPTGYTRSGLDLDALRMYLRWRGVTIEELQEDATAFRHPTTIPEDPFEATDGAIRTDGGEQLLSEQEPPAEMDAEDRSTDGRETHSEGDPDWWGAEAFLDDVGYAYGTTPDTLRDGLEVLVTRKTVWVSPGTPFMVPIFAGLVTALLYGNMVFAGLRLVGAV